jgi:hypothetical protein
MSLKITTEIQIMAPASSVWEVLIDFARYPEWNPFILEVQGAVQEGASVRYRFEFPRGIRLWATAKILRFEQQKELRWAAHFLTPALFSGEHYFTIEPADDCNITFRHGETFTGLLLPLVLPLLGICGRQAYEGLNNALKERAESLVKSVTSQ